MAVANPSDVESLLRVGDEDKLFGEKERSWLDFKGSPYVLADEKHKVELAKDIAALANTGGGCIVIGIHTRKDPTDIDEYAAEGKPFPCDLIDAAQYHDVIERSVYPPLHEVRIESFPRGERCLAMIIVGEQDEDQLPVLLQRQVDAEGKRVDAISVPSRTGSQTRWAPVGQIHRDMADGRRSRRTGTPPVMPPEPGTGDLEQESFEERMRERASDIESFMEWQERAVVMLSSMPARPADRIPGFYERDGLRGKFESPPQLRHAGFGIGWSAQSQFEGGSLVASDTSRCRWLDPDGFFSVAVVADEHMLGRSPRPSRQPRRLQVSPISVVEFTYEFCRFTHEQLVAAVPSSWKMGLLVRGAQTRPWSLQLGPGSAFDPFVAEASTTAISDEWFKAFVSTGDPAADAYRLLVHFYDLFAQPESHIPHVTDGGVDVESILAL